MTKKHYYSLLDTVYFGQNVTAKEAATQAVQVTGVLMLDMLVGGATPLLSQTQAFDNALLLSQLADPSPESWALLKLVRQGRIHIRIRPLQNHSDQSTRPGLVQAFCAALQQPAFMLSAWPELNDPQLRTVLSEYVTHNPDEVSTLGNPDLEARIEGLRELDSSLRQAPTSDWTFTPNRPMALAIPVQQGLHELAKTDSVTSHEITKVLNYAASLTLTELDKRSTWYHLITDLSNDDLPSDIAANIRGIVDGVYNNVVATSLGATGVFTQCANTEVAGALAAVELNGVAGSQLAKLAMDPRRSEWLTWAKLVEIIDDFDQLASPARRLRCLTAQHQQFVGEQALDASPVVALRVALPSVVAGLVAGAGAGAVAEIVGGGFGAVVGATVGGLVSLFAAHPTVGRIQKWWSSKAQDKAATRWEATVTTGTASWS